MKRIYLIVTAAAILFIACNNPSVPEQHGQDERLFGRNISRNIGMGSWFGIDTDRHSLSFVDATGGRTSSVSFTVATGNTNLTIKTYISTDWYTKGGKIYATKIRSSIMSDPPVGDAVFNYRFRGDTLTLSGGPRSGVIAQFTGEYFYYDADSAHAAECANSPHPGCW